MAICVKQFRWWIVMLQLLCVIRVRAQDNEMYSYIDEESTILRKGDSEFDYIKLEVPVHFYSEVYDHVYVNTNGILTFVTEYPEFINQPIPLEYPSIAVFYSNVDTSAGNESTLILFYKTQSPDKLSKASELVRTSFIDSEDFTATIIYVTTWENVGYYQAKNDKLNTFQAAIICNENETYVQYIYPENGLNWLQADVGELGLPDIRAQAGFVAEDSRHYVLPGSGTENARFLSSLSNINIPGVWLFRLGGLSYEENVGLPNVEHSSEQMEPNTCAQGQHKCSAHGSCIDTIAGLCCKCNDGYYGNGLQCIKSNIPIRVTGSITGTINGKQLSDNTKLQSYIVLADGRSYSAVNPIAADLATELQLALPIGGAIGWLFAKPFGYAKNGYDITGGVLNHLSTMRFDGTGEVFTINQTFEGLNYWDQLAVKVEVSGDLPSIPAESKLEIADFMEEYRFVSDNEIQSSGTIQVKVSDTQILDYTLDQTMIFERCRLDNESSLAVEQPVLQKVSRINIEYHGREQAIRIGMLNKIGLDPESNACNDGTASCGANTICVPRGEEYDCVCKNGYTVFDTQMSIEICVDIDECQAPNACDERAYCVNELGGYSCTCIEGYYGNGRQCFKVGSENPPTEENSQPPETYVEETTVQQPNYNETELYESECHKCSRDAQCQNDRCICNDGFIGNGYECFPDCPPGQTWINGRCGQLDFEETYQQNQTMLECSSEGVCYCPEDFRFDEEANICTQMEELPPLTCHQDFNCHVNATCEWYEEDRSYRCVCPRGYEGDGMTCQKLEVSCTTKEDLCDVHASCVYNEGMGKSECRCDKGYEGDGFTCQLAPDCSVDEDCSGKAQCDNGVCICLQGYERDRSDFCVPVGSCGGAYCAENALCKMDPTTHVPYCECLDGYVGDGLKDCKSIPPPCNIRNTCGLHAACAPSSQDYSKFECVCDPGYYGDGYLCIEERNCRNTPSLCDRNAKCMTTAVGLQCICNGGFLGNGTYCKEIQHESGFLLISQGVVILRIPIDGKLGKPISVAQMAIGLDKDCAEGRIYWGDISARKIMSAKYDGTDAKPFITEDIQSPEGIAVDWMSRRLYWTDSTKDTIEVASLDNPKQRAVVISKHLVNPRGIAVDPHRSKLFWSDWNREAPKIEMSQLDGTEREILLSKPSVTLPNSLVIFRSTGDLCFADAGTRKVECLSVDSKQVRTIAGNLSYPFGLTSTADHFYWTDWTTKKVENVDVYGVRKQSIRTPVFGSQKMYGMTAVTEDCPVYYSPCITDNGGCPVDRLCLINLKAPSGKSCKCIANSTCSNDVINVDFMHI